MPSHASQRGSDGEDEPGVKEAEHALEQSQNDKPVHTVVENGPGAAAATASTARKVLGTIKLRHTMTEQEALGESVFPYYADSTPDNIAAEADEFVLKRNIPTTHVAAIVHAALLKKEKALALARETRQPKSTRRGLA